MSIASGLSTPFDCDDLENVECVLSEYVTVSDSDDVFQSAAKDVESGAESDQEITQSTDESVIDSPVTSPANNDVKFIWKVIKDDIWLLVMFAVIATMLFIIFEVFLLATYCYFSWAGICEIVF